MKLIYALLLSVAMILVASAASPKPGAEQPPIAAAVSTTPAGGHQVTLTVTPGTGGGQVTGYNFLRSTVNGGPYTQLTPGTSTTTTYVDTQSLVEGTTYYYVAQATGPGGTSSNSPQATATIPFLPPAIPSGLSAVSQ